MHPSGERFCRLQLRCELLRKDCAIPLQAMITPGEPAGFQAVQQQAHLGGKQWRCAQGHGLTVDVPRVRSRLMPRESCVLVGVPNAAQALEGKLEAENLDAAMEHAKRGPVSAATVEQPLREWPQVIDVQPDGDGLTAPIL